MQTLVIDCATEACSVALFDNEELVSGQYEVLGRGHAERLVPMIAQLPQRGRADRVAVALGPGSFTGLRVGMAAARALAYAWDAQLVGYPTLDLVAAIAREETAGASVAVAMTGGHGDWFTQGFDASGGKTRPLASLEPGRAAHEATEHHVAGSQAEALVELRGFGIAHATLPDARRFNVLPDGSVTEDVRPTYGRPPDAKLPGGRQ